MNSSIDPKSGFCSKTKAYKSLRPPVSLPDENLPLSAAAHSLSLLHRSTSSPETTTLLIDYKTGTRLSATQFLQHVESLAAHLHSNLNLSKGDTAFILLPASIQVTILYFSLLSLGVVISPANPLSTKPEIRHQIHLSDPTIAFATSLTAGKLPSASSFRRGIVLVDSPVFGAMMTTSSTSRFDLNKIRVNQSEPAAILYSSGTTGKVKGAVLTHRNLIALIGGYFETKLEPTEENPLPDVALMTLPMFHVFGLFMCVRAVALAEAVVVLERFDFEAMLKAIEAYKVTYMPVSPPLLVAMVKSDLVAKYDLSSLKLLGCGGAPLGKDVAERFAARFPDIEIVQGYGMTESTGSAARAIGPEESERYGSVGRLAENMEAKIVDPTTREAMPPGQEGELWLRGPIIMKGYAKDEEATANTFEPDGWLKTGDLCYFDSDGFLYIVDRLKELIKYKAYQVPPAELEQLLQSHPEVTDAAVIPYPDEEAGQIPMAFVVRKPGSDINETEVMDYIARKVAPYKKIRRVAFLNAIPKNPSGKILRRELVKQALSSASSKL